MSATVVRLDDWRDPERLLERPEVLEHAERTRQRQPHGWHDLAWIGQTDRRDGLRIYRRLGLHVHLLHGVVEDARTHPPYGVCTCHKGASCGRSTGKHPTDGQWQSARFDFDRIDRALVRDYRFNLGWRMGPQPNGTTIICFDVDGDRTLLDDLESSRGKLPETLTASTGRGLHLFFRLAPTSAIPGNTKLAGIQAIDIRSVGGQVVLAPSRHYSGAQYTWVHCIEPAEIEL